MNSTRPPLSIFSFFSKENIRVKYIQISGAIELKQESLQPENTRNEFIVRLPNTREVVVVQADEINAKQKKDVVESRKRDWVETIERVIWFLEKLKGEMNKEQGFLVHGRVKGKESLDPYTEIFVEAESFMLDLGVSIKDIIKVDDALLFFKDFLARFKALVEKS